MVKNVLVCIDRDGTIDYDNKYHLGHQKNWKSKVRILEGVVSGIKKLQKIDRVRTYIISNQPGVAVKNFPLLTEKKAVEVCDYVIYRLKKKGAKIDGCVVCGKATHSYVKKRMEFKFDKALVCNCFCIKPSPGMVYKAMGDAEFKVVDTNIYVIGDRVSDVKTGINAGGFGILVPFVNLKGEVHKVDRLTSRKKYIAKDFLDAVEFIMEKES